MMNYKMLSLDTTNATSLWDFLSPDLEIKILELVGGLEHREKMEEILDALPYVFYNCWTAFSERWGRSSGEYFNPFTVSVVPQNYSALMDIIRINGWSGDDGQIEFSNDPNNYGWWFDQNQMWGDCTVDDEEDLNRFHPGHWSDSNNERILFPKWE